MRKIFFILTMGLISIMGACEKDDVGAPDNYGDGPKTNVPAGLQGNWMYGNFSMTEYWSQNPSEYLGNTFEVAIAFKFNDNGTYEQYFTSKSVLGTVVTYHQSFTKGTVVINEAEKSIITYAAYAHYKQTKNGVTTEDRDLTQNEITRVTKYEYEERTEPNGTKAIYLKMNNTENPFQFLKK